MQKFNAGTKINQGYYKSFQPHPINKQWELQDMELLNLLSKADRHLGRLDMYSEHIPDIDLFISMHVVKEATQSSRIEGTQTNIEEALLEKQNVNPEKKDDWEEVQNYIAAMNQAIAMLGSIPFSSRLIKETHKVLLQGVRGDHKMPGVFRTSQNWIGGASINDAVFVPPTHNTIAELMSDLEHFAHNESIFFPDLLKIALIHYQFETIHPFLDGNGRIGRLLIVLMLVESGILSEPIVYPSYYFKKRNFDYYKFLDGVRTNGDFESWITSYLGVIRDSSIDACRRAQDIERLRENMKDAVIDDERLSNVRESRLQAIPVFFNFPVMSIKTVQEQLGVSYNTAHKIISDFSPGKALNALVIFHFIISSSLYVCNNFSKISNDILFFE